MKIQQLHHPSLTIKTLEHTEMAFFLGQLTQRIYGTEVSFDSPILIETELDLLNPQHQQINVDHIIEQAIAEDEDFAFLFQEEPELIFSVSVQHKIDDPKHLEGIKLTYPHNLKIEH